MLRFIKILILVLVLFSALAVHLRNDQIVTFNYYLGSIDMPFSLSIVIAVCLGAVLGIIALLPTLFRLKKEKARLSSRVRLNEQELKTLRIIPLKD